MTWPRRQLQKHWNIRESKHNIVLVLLAIWCVLRVQLAFILKDDLEVHDAFEVVLFQGVGTRSLAMKVAKVLLSDPAILGPSGQTWCK